MGKKSTPAPPQSPDPQQLIEAQKEANRINTYTPYGSTIFGEGPEGQAMSVSKMSPLVEAILGQAAHSAMNKQFLSDPTGLDTSALSKAFSLAGLGGVPDANPFPMGLPQFESTSISMDDIKDLIALTSAGMPTPIIPKKEEEKPGIDKGIDTGLVGRESFSRGFV